MRDRFGALGTSPDWRAETGDTANAAIKINPITPINFLMRSEIISSIPLVKILILEQLIEGDHRALRIRILVQL